MTEGVKDIGEAVTPSATPADDNGKGFYDDIPEPTEEAEESAPSEESEEQEITEESESNSKKDASSRIRELNSKAKDAEAKAASLAKQIEELTASSQQPQYGDWGNQYPQSETGEITAEELEARAVQRAMALTEIKMQQQRMLDRVQKEADEVLKEYPELDPDGDRHNADLSEAITEAALAYVKQNPNKSLKAYVQKLMKPYKGAVAREVGDLADTVTRQAAEKALRPTSTPKGEKRLEDMSEKELEERLGTVY